MLKLSVVKGENVYKEKQSNFQMSNTSSDPSKGDGIKTNNCADDEYYIDASDSSKIIHSVNDIGSVSSPTHNASTNHKVFLYICNNDCCTKEGNAIKGTSAKTLIIEFGVCTVKVIDSHCISDSFFFLLDSITYDAVWGITETTAGIYLYFFDPNNDRMDPSIQSLTDYELEDSTQVHEQHCKTSERKVSQRFLERVASFNVVNDIVKVVQSLLFSLKSCDPKDEGKTGACNKIYFVKGNLASSNSIAVDSYPEDTNKYIIKVYNEYNLYDVDQSVPNNIAISINEDDCNINSYDIFYDQNGPAERFNGILIKYLKGNATDALNFFRGYSWKLQTISFYSTKKFSNFIPNSEMRGTINDNSSVDNNTNIDINSKREPKDFDDIFYLPDKEE
ncbi:hypothetical protein H8356DRAFT_1382031 [Neocallimastix lanati (nom. inval.)]|nr:hypothetical protein H8356DRAFT_1382031 [Neocallimastix sp. JGI-2020a]